MEFLLRIYQKTNFACGHVDVSWNMSDSELAEILVVCRPLKKARKIEKRIEKKKKQS